MRGCWCWSDYCCKGWDELSYSVPVSQPSEVLGLFASCISFPIYPPFKAPSKKKPQVFYCISWLNSNTSWIASSFKAFTLMCTYTNTSYCFQDEYGQSHTDNNNQIFGVHKNETAIHFSSVPLLWSASKISIAYDSIYLSRMRRWFLWRMNWIFVIRMGESFSNGWIKISGCTISSSDVGKPWSGLSKLSSTLIDLLLD